MGWRKAEKICEQLKDVSRGDVRLGPAGSMDRASAFGNIFPRDSGIAEGSGFESQVGRLFYFHGVSLHSTEQLNVVRYGAILCPRHSYLTPSSLHSKALPIAELYFMLTGRTHIH